MFGLILIQHLMNEFVVLTTFPCLLVRSVLDEQLTLLSFESQLTHTALHLHTSTEYARLIMFKSVTF